MLTLHLNRNINPKKIMKKYKIKYSFESRATQMRTKKN